MDQYPLHRQPPLTMSGGLRRYDAFVKTRPDMRTKSAVGGIITLVATTAAVLVK